MMKVFILISPLLFFVEFLNLYPLRFGHSSSIHNKTKIKNQDDAWTGTYKGYIEGVEAVMKLQLTKDRVTGTVDAGGYLYQINWSVEGSECMGNIVDLQTKGSMQSRGIKEGKKIKVVVIEGYNSFQIEFYPLNEKDASENSTKDQPAQTLDPNLFGHWIYSNSYTSGSYSAHFAPLQLIRSFLRDVSRALLVLFFGCTFNVWIFCRQR